MGTYATLDKATTSANFSKAPQKTAEPPRHLISYAGQALEFDGVSDYITIPNLGKTTAFGGSHGNVTVAFWFKSSDADGTFLDFGGRTYSTKLRIYLNSGSLRMRGNGFSIKTTKTFNDNEWHYLVLVRDKTLASQNIKLYVDGVHITEYTGDTDDSTTDNEGSAYSTSILGGNVHGGSNPDYSGYMCNFQIWTKSWSSSDVIFAYENPELLITRNSHVTSGIDSKDLELWYPMNGQNSRFAIDAEKSVTTTPLGNANPLLDCSYKGPGDEILTNPSLTGTYDTAQDYSAGFTIVDGYIVHTAGSGGSPHTVTEGDNNGSQCIEISSTSSAGNYVNFRAAVTLDIVQGRTYKLQFDAQSTTGSDTHLNVGVHTGANIAYGYVDGMVASGTSGTGDGGTSALTVTSTMTTYTFYLTAAASDSTSYLVFGRRGGEAACKCLIDNISFKEMQGGRHGETTFYSLTTDLLNDSQKAASGLDDVIASSGEYIDFTGSDGTLTDLDSTELVTNGDFPSGLSDGDHGYDNGNNTVDGWTATNSAHLSIVSNKLKILNSTTAAGRAIYAFTTVVGETYEVKVDYDTQTGGATEAALRVGYTSGGAQYGEVRNTSNDPSLVMHFTASLTTGYIMLDLYSDNVSGHYLLADNVSVKKVDKFAVGILDKTGANGGISSEASFAVSSNKGELKAVNSKQPIVMIPFQTTPGRAYQVKLATDDSSGTNSPGGAYIGVSTYPLTYTGGSGSSLSVKSGEAKIRTGGTGWLSGGSTSVNIVAKGQYSYAFIYNESATTDSARDYTGLYIQEEGYGQGWQNADQQTTIPQSTFLNGSRKMFWDGTNYVTLPSDPLVGLSNFTVNIWSQKPVGTESHVLISQSGGGTYWRWTGVTNFIAYLNLSTTSAAMTANASHGLIDDGAMHMYTITYDGTTFNLYQDGNVLKTTTSVEGTLATPFLRIGNYAGTDTDGGWSDECSKWTTALTQAEIIELYNDGVFKDAREHSQKNNLVGYWKNNVLTSENDTTVAWKDHATEALSLASNSTGGSLKHLSTGSKTMSLPTGEFTLNCWINPEQLGDSDSTVRYICSNGANNRIYISQYSNQQMVVQVGGWGSTFTHGHTFALNTWSMLTVVIAKNGNTTGNGSDLSVTIYKDGVAGTTHEGQSADSIPTEFLFDYIGRYSTTLNFTGLIDNYALLNKALTSTEVASLYSAGRQTSAIDTLGGNNNFGLYYMFEAENRESNGDISDLSGNSNHGSLENSATISGGNHGTVTGLGVSVDTKNEIFINEAPNSTTDIRIDGMGMELNIDHSIDHGLYFFGQSDIGYGPYMRLNNELTLSDNFTICFWIKDNHMRTNRILGGTSNTFIKTGASNYIYYRANTDGSGFSTAYQLTFNSTTDPSGLNYHTTQRWHHIVIRKKTGVLQYYYDGVLQSNTETVDQDFNLKYIGSHTTAYTGHGWIDDILCYDQPLGNTDIQNIYNRGKAQHPQDESMDEV